ncbi:DUF84 family protein [Mycoplasmatota bacterium]|nr:DUF84 family protein [Mycoplasmatota bacterium]
MSNLKIVVGSSNKVKVNAIKNIFANYEVVGIAVKSKVSDQPISDEETIRGALNRALGAKRFGDIGIGLEGGVQQTSFGMLVVNYGVLVDEKSQVYLAGGSRFLLPNEVSKDIYKGKELGDIMDQYANKRNVKHDEGAVGIFTNNFVKRTEIFEHIGLLLYGQMVSGKNNININNNR